MRDYEYSLPDRIKNANKKIKSLKEVFLELEDTGEKWKIKKEMGNIMKSMKNYINIYKKIGGKNGLISDNIINNLKYIVKKRKVEKKKLKDNSGKTNYLLKLSKKRLRKKLNY